MQVDGRVVFITGAASGIGAAMARAFAAAGAAKVVVADVDARGAEAVAASIDGMPIALDVTDEQATIDAVASVTASHGGIDILCLNAGIAIAGSVDAPDEDWQRIWDVNLMAHVYALRAALPQMIERGEGYVVTTASAAGLLTNIGAAPYAVTKHAAVALAEWVAITYGDAGVGVSCLCPQFVDTPMLDVFSDRSDAMQTWVRDLAVSPDDVAAQVLEAVRAERFLVLPHPEVGSYFRNKATDYDRWIAGMRRLQASFRP